MGAEGCEVFRQAECKQGSTDGKKSWWVCLFYLVLFYATLLDTVYHSKCGVAIYSERHLHLGNILTADVENHSS